MEFPDSGNYGSGGKEQSFRWLATLSDVLGSHFREGMSVLDYGCGHGRYARFLQERLSAFTYYGLEKSGGTGLGEHSICEGRALFAGASNITFGLIGNGLERDALMWSDVGVLGSVITRTALEETRSILRRLRPIAGRGGVIVASVFIGEQYALGDPGAYGFEDCYSRVQYTDMQLSDLLEELGLVGVEGESFAAGSDVHRIFRIENAV